MCGIAGYATAAGRQPLGQPTLLAMLSTLRHRGPDDDGTLLAHGVGLGHRRLSIIDVAGGRNPLGDDEGRVSLVFNGEIYNHRTLRAELEAGGRRPSSHSDGEVILHGYLAWGLLPMLRRLRGMYALALLDHRDGSLHLARDPLGIKPLFVQQDADGLRFGSEMKAILAARPGSPRVSREGLLQAAALGYTLGPGTIYAGIEAVPPGGALSYLDGRRTDRRHHQLVFEPGRERADGDELWARLGTSVASHLMSEVPLGAFLSGGVDSSAVVTAMREVSEGQVDAVCVGVDQLDERPFAREVAQALGVTLHEEAAVPELLDLLPRLAWHLEQPFGDTSAAPTWLVCEGARRHVTVALSGDGGDENFAGYRRTRYDVLEDAWRARIPGFVRRRLLAPLGRSWPRGSWLPGPLRAGTLLTNLGSDWLDAYVHSLARIPEDRARRLLRPEVRHEGPLRSAFEPHAARAAHLDALSRVQSMDFATWLADDILVKVDRTSMAHSLEVRVPLLDTDFVEWAAGLPTAAKLHRGRGKVLFKRALRGRVPDVVLDRPKQGFHLPVGAWMRTTLRGRLEEVLSDAQGPAFDLVEPARFRRLLDEHLAERADRSAELWWLLSLDAFCRHGPGGTEAPRAAPVSPASVATPDGSVP